MSASFLGLTLAVLPWELMVLLAVSMDGILPCPSEGPPSP